MEIGTIVMDRKAPGLLLEPGRHVELPDLFRALEEGLDSRGCRNLLAHVGSGCPECCKVVGILAELMKEEPRCPPPDGPWSPVVSAVWRWAMAAGWPGALSRLRGKHRWFAISRDLESFVFSRLVIEEMLHRVLTRDGGLTRGGGQQLVEATYELFAGLPALDGPQGPESLWRYLASHHREHLVLLRGYRIAESGAEARKPLQELIAGVDRDFDAEILATLYELSADAARGAGDFRRAIQDLRESRKLLRISGADDEIPGRLAEHLLRLGMAWSGDGMPRRAIEAFADGLRLQSLLDPHTRAETLHHLAGAEIAASRYKDAKTHLEEAEQLFQAHATARIRLEQDWMWAVIDQQAGRYAAAEKRFRKVLEVLKECGSPKEVALVFANLSQLYERTGDSSKMLNVVFDYLDVLRRRPDVRMAYEAELVEVASAYGLDLSALIGTGGPLN